MASSTLDQDYIWDKLEHHFPNEDKAQASTENKSSIERKDKSANENS
jgi:hypothetical protein